MGPVDYSAEFALHCHCHWKLVEGFMQKGQVLCG